MSGRFVLISNLTVTPTGSEVGRDPGYLKRLGNLCDSDGNRTHIKRLGNAYSIR